MATSKETVHMGADAPDTELCVMHSPAGYYLGYMDEDGSPYSRETVYMPKAQAERLLLGLCQGDDQTKEYIKKNYFR